MFINGLVGFELISPELGSAFMYGSTGALLARPEFWKWFIRIGILIYGLSKLFHFLVEVYKSKGKNLIIPGLATSLVAIIAIVLSSVITGCSYGIQSVKSSPSGDNLVAEYVIDDTVVENIDDLEVKVSGDLYVDSDGVFSSSFSTPNENEVRDFSDEVSFGRNVVVSNSFSIKDYLGTQDKAKIKPRSSSVKKSNSPVTYSHTVADPIIPKLGRFVCSQESATLRCTKKFYCEQYTNLLYGSDVGTGSEFSSFIYKGKKKLKLRTCLLWTNEKLSKMLAELDHEKGLVYSKQLSDVISVYRSCKKRKIKNGFDFVNPFSNLRTLTRSSDDAR